MCVLGCKYVCAKSVNVGSPGKKKKKSLIAWRALVFNTEHLSFWCHLQRAGAHPYLGCTVLTLALLQPIMATLRPPPDSSR